MTITGVTCTVIFCEDIRAETSRKQTLIGIFPPSIQISKFPIALPRFAVFFRLKFDLSMIFKKPIGVFLDGYGDDFLKAPNPIDRETLQRIIARAKERQRPFASVVTKFEYGEPLTIHVPTLITAGVQSGEEKTICGYLSIEAAKNTVSELPSSQTPS